MRIICPGCATRYLFDEERMGDTGITFRCGRCRIVFRMQKRLVRIKKKSGPALVAVSNIRRSKVLVANENPAFCTAIRKVLVGEPFDIDFYQDGREALEAIINKKPDAVLLDVALPSMFGFEVCEEVRKNPELDEVRLILVASIHDKAKYKRTPQSLYGADAYIEKHHLVDSLAALLHRLIAGELPDDWTPPEIQRTTALAGETYEEPAPQEEIQEEEPVTICPVEQKKALEKELAEKKLSDAHVKAKRLARIIASDILLYNQATVAKGVKNGTFYELLADDVNEGRELYRRRVSEEIRSGTTYLDDAFDQLIEKKRQELGL